MSDEPNNLENLRCEYSQVNQNFRHFNLVRIMVFCFYLLVFFVAIIFTFSQFQVGWTRGGIQEGVSKILWFFVTAVFLGFDVYFELNVRQLRLIAREIEEQLCLKQFIRLNSPKLNWLAYVIWGTYTIFLFFWLSAG